MSKFLYRLGKNAYDKPWYYIVGWIVILGITITMVGVNGVHVSSDIKIKGTESQKVLDKLVEELPAASGGQASVVFTVPKGERLDTPERLAAISKVVNVIHGMDYVINPADFASAAAGDEGAAPSVEPQSSASNATGQAAPANIPSFGPLIFDNAAVPGVLISAEGSVALFQFQFTVQQYSLPKSLPEEIVKAVTELEVGTGITTLPSDSLKALEIPIGPFEIIGLVIAAFVLIMTLGSLVAAGLPLLTALIGVGIGVDSAFAISSTIEINSVTPVLALMVGLAVGIDYALFIVNRQRRIIFDQNLSAREAASRAVGTAGSAVIFAGLTVIIALCGLVIIGITFLTSMALVAAFTVLLDVLIALTLLPALLGLVGERICSPKARDNNRVKLANQHRGLADRWVKGIVKLRWPSSSALL